MLEVRDVGKTYREGGREVHAVRGVSLRVEPGEMVVLLGRSGSGKSTLLHLLGGLDRPSSGSVLFEGRDLASLHDDALTRLRRDRIGHVFQFFNLLPTLTAAENVALPILLGGTSDRVATARARAALDEVGLADRADHFPEEMSGGEQQRTAIARALAVRPSLLLADEPTGNLDTDTGREVLGLLRGLTADGTRSIVMVTHDEQAALVGDRRIRLKDGRIEREER
ncbi:MAG: ABC transporter ATP-binding protein [Planctomycetes bacterium]|nr:ABC transporter ATP-binding protein [Planctomycetota bacterium]